LIKFVAHSINKLRGKPDEEYLDILYKRESITLRNPWKAVEVISGSRQCTASKLLKGKRFLNAEAPKLPLSECTEVHCTCRYRHFADRRVGPRRAAESGVGLHEMKGSRFRVDQAHWESLIDWLEDGKVPAGKMPWAEVGPAEATSADEASAEAETESTAVAPEQDLPLRLFNVSAFIKRDS
jgi:hypothetical protein